MRNGGWALALLLLAGGCHGNGSDPAGDETLTEAPDAGLEAAAPEASEPADGTTDAATAEAPAASGRSEKEANDLYEFGYAYPDEAGAIPGLRAILDRQLVAARSDLIAGARGDRDAAKKDGYPYHAHSVDQTWKVVTQLPGWLSLSAERYEFSGGAHGMSSFDTLLWDRRTDSVRHPVELFASKDALRVAIQGPFCDALDQERAKRRGEPVQRNSGQMFSECIDPVASTLILGSANGATFDRIGVLVGPYEAGPYAEGTYEVTLPVTGKVMAALKPQYRTSFSVK